MKSVSSSETFGVRFSFQYVRSRRELAKVMSREQIRSFVLNVLFLNIDFENDAAYFIGICVCADSPVAEVRITNIKGQKGVDSATATAFVVRTEWTKEDPLALGEQSVLFGFTSDNPPAGGEMVIESPATDGGQGGGVIPGIAGGELPIPGAISDEFATAPSYSKQKNVVREG